MGAIYLAPQELRPHHKVKYHGQTHSIRPAGAPLWTRSCSCRQQSAPAWRPRPASLPGCSGPVHSGGQQAAAPASLPSHSAPEPSQNLPPLVLPIPLSQCQETPPPRLAFSPEAVLLVQQPKASPRASQVPAPVGTRQLLPQARAAPGWPSLQDSPRGPKGLQPSTHVTVERSGEAG